MLSKFKMQELRNRLIICGSILPATEVKLSAGELEYLLNTLENSQNTFMAINKIFEDSDQRSLRRSLNHIQKLVRDQFHS